MRRLFPSVTLVALLAAALWLTATASAQPIKFFAALTGAAECSAPGVCGTGDPDGIGTAELTINPSHAQICWKITVMNIALPGTAQHIHRAPIGSPGPVVVPLLPPPDATGTSSGCVSAAPALIVTITNHPGLFYVNVHNADFPAGAVRGQLTRVP